MVKNNKLKKYISIPIYDKISLLSKNKGEELNKFSKYISTSEFLEKSNKAIEKRIEYEKNISFSKRLNRKFQSFKRKTSKLAGNISEGLSLEYVYKNGQQPYIGIDFIENIKDFIAGSKKLFLKKQKNINNPEQNSLVKLINKLSK